MTKFQASPQQADFLKWVEEGVGNARVDAVAGAGKTTVLMQGILRMKGRVLYVVFGKKNAVEAQGRLAELTVDPSMKEASTVHSAGLRAFKKYLGSKGRGLKIEGKKTQLIYEDLYPPKQGEDDPLAGITRECVDMAKQRAFGIIHPITDRSKWYEMIEHFGIDENLSEDSAEDVIEEVIERAMRVLKRSYETLSTRIDFSDMILAPLWVKARLEQYDWVLIDEAQDTNPARRALAKALLKPGGRFVAVGDPRQAIMGFAGADNSAMDLIEQEMGCTRMPLTVSFRCPIKVVKYAQKWVSHIEPHPSAPVGSLTETGSDKLFDLLVEGHKAGEIASDFVICRYNKPLAQLAYALLKRRIPCRIEGKEIGKSLLVLAGKWKIRGSSELSTLSDKLSEYKEVETQKLLSKGREKQAELLSDKVEVLQVLIEGLLSENKTTLADLRTLITSLFSDKDEVEKTGRKVLTLMTGHKSKGLETKRVWWLGFNAYHPSKFARKDWQLEQEANICYVIATRAQRELVLVNVIKE